VVLFAFDPYVIVTKTKVNTTEEQVTDSSNFIRLFASGKIGFALQQEAASPLVKALSEKACVDITEVFYETTHTMAQALWKCEIVAG